MLRLKTPEKDRFLQRPFFEATFGGAEANVAVGLSRLGLKTGFISALPLNEIGDSCVEQLRKHGLGVDSILRTGNRLGIYFLENGSNQRPSKVIYDRSGSSIAEADPGLYKWKDILADSSWFHFSGITPAISQNAADAALSAVKAAKKLGLTVSCDFNYRSKLWKYGKTSEEVMTPLMSFVDIAIGNEEDCQKSLGISIDVDVNSGSLSVDKYKELTAKVLHKFPNLKKIAITLRESHSANHNDWSAVLNTGKEFHISKKYSITNIVDRVGAGDAFSAGLIYSIIKEKNDTDSLSFAVAASALQHTISGDLPLLSLKEVENLQAGDSSGRVQR